MPLTPPANGAEVNVIDVGMPVVALAQKLIKIGAKVVRHSKYVRFQLAEVAVPRKLFAAILERIQRLSRAENGLVLSG